MASTRVDATSAITISSLGRSLRSWLPSPGERNMLRRWASPTHSTAGNSTGGYAALHEELTEGADYNARGALSASLEPPRASYLVVKVRLMMLIIPSQWLSTTHFPPHTPLWLSTIFLSGPTGQSRFYIRCFDVILYPTMPIADRAREIASLLEKWRASFDPSSPDVEEAGNQLFRFNLWISNNFVFESPRASIDWRLRHASVLQSTMEDLLDDLRNSLTGDTLDSNICSYQFVLG